MVTAHLVVFEPFGLSCLGHCCLSRAGLKDSPSDIRPRAFPLGLLAPRLLGAVLFPRISRLRAGARAPLLFGERKESSPQLRSPPRSGDLMFTVLTDFFFSLSLVTSFFRPSESALAQPLFSFSFQSLICRFRLRFL